MGFGIMNGSRCYACGKWHGWSGCRDAGTWKTSKEDVEAMLISNNEKHKEALDGKAGK